MNRFPSLLTTMLKGYDCLVRRFVSSRSPNGGAPDLRLTPLLPEVFRTHLLIGLETSGGKHYRAGSDLLSSFRGLADHPRHGAVLVLDEIHHRVLVADLDPTLRSSFRVLFHQSPAAIDRSQNEPAPETPLAVHLERLPIIHQAEAQPFFAQPSNSLPGIVYQDTCKGPVALAFRHPYHVGHEVFGCVGV